MSSDTASACDHLLPLEGVRLIAYRMSIKYDVSLKEIRSHMRSSFLNAIRREIIRDARYEGFTTTQIGRFLNRDHTTICHHMKIMRRQLVPGQRPIL